MKCVRCGKDLPRSSFSINSKTGELKKTCDFCCEQKKSWQLRQAGKPAEVVSRLDTNKPKKPAPEKKPIVKAKPPVVVEKKDDNKFKTNKIRFACFGDGRKILYKLFDFYTESGNVLFIFKVSKQDENYFTDFSFKRLFSIEQESRILTAHRLKPMKTSYSKENQLKALYGEENPFKKDWYAILKIIKGRLSPSLERRRELLDYKLPLNYDEL